MARGETKACEEAKRWLEAWREIEARRGLEEWRGDGSRRDQVL
jgi:hypothetical protein